MQQIKSFDKSVKHLKVPFGLSSDSSGDFDVILRPKFNSDQFGPKTHFVEHFKSYRMICIDLTFAWNGDLNLALIRWPVSSSADWKWKGKVESFSPNQIRSMWHRCGRHWKQNLWPSGTRSNYRHTIRKRVGVGDGRVMKVRPWLRPLKTNRRTWSKDKNKWTSNEQRRISERTAAEVWKRAVMQMSGRGAFDFRSAPFPPRVHWRNYWISWRFLLHFLIR